MTSGNPTQQIALPAQGCDTVTVSGYFTAAGECADNINTAMIVTAGNDTITTDTCVTVMFPCWEPGIGMIADSTYSSTLSQVVYTNDTMYLEGVLFVDDDLWLYGCMIYTAPGAHIIVMPGANLTIDSATVIEGCETMWQGITLRSPFSSVWVDNSSKIKDAECGIYANDTTEFYVLNSEITESISGITTHADSTGNYRNITGRVEGTKFGMWNSGTLKPAYNGQPPHGSIPRAGMELNNVAGMVIGNYANNKNQFNRMHSGVVGWGSDFRVLHCEFTNLLHDAAYSTEYAGTAVISKGDMFISKARVRFQHVGGGGNTVTACLRGAYTNFSDAVITNVKMEGVNIGVFSSHTSLSKEVTVEACEITASKYGVYFYANAGAKNMTAQDNTIYVSTKGSIGILAEEMTSASTVPYRIERNFVQTTNGYGGIVCNNLNRPVIDYNSIRFSHASAAAQMYGIEISANVRPQVSCNNIMSNTVSAADSTKIGIAVKISTNSNVSCNTVDSTGYGFFFGGICTGTSFKGNYIGHHYTGLYLNKVAVISQQPGGGAPPYHGNTWLDTTAYTSGYGAVNMNDSIFLLQQSLFTINPNSLNYNPRIPLNSGNPPFYVDNTLWFDFGSGSTFSCSTSTICNAAFISGGDEDIDLRERIANDESITSEYVPESKSIAKRFLLDELRDDSTLAFGNTTLEYFVTANENSNYGYLYSAEKSIKQAINLSDSLQAVFNSIDSLHNILSDSLYDASTMINLFMHTFLINELNTMNSLRIGLLENAQLSSNEKLNEASVYNNLISGSDDPIRNLKFINTVLNLYLRNGRNGISPYYNDVLAVASQCIYKGGVAVIRARTMVSLFPDTIQFNDVYSCSQFGIYRLAEQKHDNGASVFIKVNPNPSINMIDISITGMNEGICDIAVDDMLGQQVYKNAFACKNENFVADITILPAGVYTLKVNANGNVVKKKIIKLNGIPVLLLILILSFPFSLNAQGHNKYWLLGGDTGFPMGKFEFDTNSYNLVVQQRKMTFKGGQANYADSNGNLLVSSNGIWIADSSGDTIKNGNNLAPSYLTSIWPLGLPVSFGEIIIPFPNDNNKLFLFHSSAWDQFGISTKAIYKSIIDLTLDSIIQKNDTILADTLSWGIGACKHANGRDWWLLVSHDGNPKFYTYLITPSGIDTMFIQPVASSFNTYANVSPIIFSPDGKKILWCSPVNQTQSGHVMLSDFNRCSGIISNPVILPVSQSNYIWGLAFSSSGKFAYACTSTLMFQINTDNLNIDTIAIYDGFCFPSSPWCTTFWSIYLAANGKLYVTSGSGVQHIHEINYPDSAGMACDMQQHSIYLNGIWHLRSVPNHPNYYLGCDTTLGCTPCYTNISELSPPDLKFRAYPNPVSDGFLNIGYLLPQNKHGIFEMYDINGKVVYRYTLPPWSNYQSFNLTQLSDGIYQCVITSDGKRAVKKVAVIRQ